MRTGCYEIRRAMPCPPDALDPALLSGVSSWEGEEALRCFVVLGQEAGQWVGLGLSWVLAARPDLEAAFEKLASCRALLTEVRAEDIVFVPSPRLVAMAWRHQLCRQAGSLPDNFVVWPVGGIA